MTEFKNILASLSQRLIEVAHEKNYTGDLSDVGNEIGIIVGDWIDENKFGFEKDSFISGIKHGISLTDGTH